MAHFLKSFLFFLIFSFTQNIYAQNTSQDSSKKHSGKNLSKETSQEEAKEASFPKNIVLKQQAVWKIKSVLQKASSSGFFISPNQFVTNFHVAEKLFNDKESKFNSVKLTQDQNPREITIKSFHSLDMASDLAIFVTEEKVDNYLDLRTQITESSKYFWIGYPSGKFEIRKISGKPYYQDDSSYHFPGSNDRMIGASGSPVLNNKGEVVAVVKASEEMSLISAKSAGIEKLLHKHFPNKNPYLVLNPHQGIKEASKKIHRLAKQGDAIAQFELGWRYADGYMIEQIGSKAASLLKKAADQGVPEARYELAQLYDEGKGVPKDKKKAASIFLQAAEEGYAIAQFELGYRYYFGIGVTQNKKEAIFWLQKSSDQGYSEAQFELGWRHYFGIGVAQNKKEGIRLYQKAANRGHPESQYVMGILNEEDKSCQTTF